MMISAVVLAAGQSKRMGRAKMLLPWGETTVIGQVVMTLAEAGLEEIVVVVGGDGDLVQKALKGTPARTVFNPEYAAGDMLSSVQVGLRAISAEAQVALVALGDQPQMRVDIVKALVQEFYRTGAALVAPSYQMRRGHPLILARRLWGDVLTVHPPQTLRDVLNMYRQEMHYLIVNTDSVLHDLDTPEDYEKHHPKANGQSDR